MLTFLLFAQLGTAQFYTRVAPETVYVGQQVTHDAVALFDRVAQFRLQGTPEYIPSQVSGATTYDFRFDSTLIADIVLRGIAYRRFIYRRAVFPLAPGEYEIPPATLQYSLAETEEYLSRQRAHTLRSEPVRFIAIPLPASGQPVDFSGAVGIFTDTAFISTTALQVGTPFTLTLRVLGVGNISLLPRPPLSIEWASTIDGDERVIWDSTGSVVRGYKEFDWMVTPNVAGALFVPAIRYDYFNPATRQYTYAVAPSIRVKIAGGGQVLSDNYHPTTDTVGTSPFPAILRLLREYWIAAAAIAVLLLFWIVFALVRSDSKPHDD